MAPTTRAGSQPAKTIAKKSPKKSAKDDTKRSAKVIGKLPTKKISKKLAAKKPAAANPLVKKIIKQAAKRIPEEATSDDPGDAESPPVSYCEGDRHLHGIYKRCGAGALFIAHKIPPNGATPASMVAALPPARKKTYAPSRMSKISKTDRSDLDYDVVVRNSARMVLSGLGDLFEKISNRPMASETSLEGVTEHVGEAIDALQAFLDSDREYINPHPEINFRRAFEGGDGIGNWISFKASWFERGVFRVGDIFPFQSTLLGLKAEGMVVSLRR